MECNQATPRAALPGDTLSALTHGLVKSFQEEIDDELPRLRDITARLLQRCGETHHNVAAPLMKVLDHFRDAMAHRLIAEADELCPLIDALEGGRGPSDAAERLAAMRSRLELEQLVMAETLDTLRLLTGRYQAPEEACSTVRDLYRSLEQLDRAVRTQLMIENAVLFPRALALAMDASRRAHEPAQALAG